jgi:hypothetical protein
MTTGEQPMSANPDDLTRDLTRRAALTGLGLGLGGAALSGVVAPGRAEAAARRTLDLDSPEGNCQALIKLQADLSGKPAMGGFPGVAWAWVPGEGNYHLFNTYGLGVSRVEYHEEEKGWRFYHREAQLYLDPKTNEVIESWLNPWTERRQEVLQVLNEHVNRFYPLSPGGRFAFPWAYELNGDDLVFRISVFRCEDSPMPRRDYPLHSQSDKYQTTELWGMIGSLREVMDPSVTSAHCVTSWARISGWLPFMEMGNRPGQLVFHSHSYKLLRGLDEVPANVRRWLEKNGPEYFEAPKTWTPPEQSIGAWAYAKKIIDERRASGLRPGQTEFSWPRG